MNAAAIISRVITIAKAIPVFNSWIESLVKAWNEKDVRQSNKIRATIQEEKRALDRAISKAETDEDIRLLSITLRNISDM